MSTTSRVIIAIVCGFSGVIFTLMAVMGATPATPWVAGFLAAFCFAITITCVPGKHTRVTNRLVGGFAFTACIVYIVAEILTPSPAGGFSQSSPSLLNAVLLFIGWGIPAGYVMIHGIYPRWGRFGEELGQDRETDDSDTDHEDLPPSKEDYQR